MNDLCCRSTLEREREEKDIVPYLSIANKLTMADADDAGVDLDGGFGDDPTQFEGEEELLDDPEVMEDDEEMDDVSYGDGQQTNTNMRGSSNKHESDEEAIVQCSTSAGPITMHFYRYWSPNGYDRATALFEKGYYDHSHFFRVVKGFLVQFGIGYTTDAELKKFSQSTIPDDPRRPELLPFKVGMMSFAGSGPNSRSSQLFIAYEGAGGLGQSPWETPFGKVTQGLDHVRNLYSGYGDMPPWGKGPEQGPIHNRGASYIESEFPLLDKFETCSVERINQAAGANENADVVKNVVEQIKKANVVNKEDSKEEAATFPFTTMLILTSIVFSILFGLGYVRKKRTKYNKTT